MRIRVIGRIDLAQQIHAALVAEGVDARLATAAPGTVIEQTGRDDTGLDILANAFDTCSAIKKAVPRRPVLMVTFEEDGGAVPMAAAYVAEIARTSRGPDAHLPWPATGAELLTACERARAAALVPRPRFSWRLATLGLALLGIVVAGTWANVYVAMLGARASATTAALASLVQAVIFGVLAWLSWRAWRRYRRAWRVATVSIWLLLTVQSLGGALHALLR